MFSRTATEAQLGYTFAVSGTEEVYRQARSLNGAASYAELLADSDRPDELRTLVSTLHEAGLVEDLDVRGARPARLAADTAQRGLARCSAQRIAEGRARAAVVVHGDGRIGIGVAVALAAAGIGQVHLVARGRVGAEDCGTGYRDGDVGRPRAETAAEVIRAASSSVNARRLVAGRVPELVLLADTPTPSPQVAAGLHGAGVAHLLAYPRDGIGVVGPLVIPGRTACVRCLDMRRVERDPCWARIATQVAGVGQPAPVAVASAVTAFATAQALRFIDGLPVPAMLAGAVDIDPDAAETTHRHWAPHPSCRCIQEPVTSGHPP